MLKAADADRDLDDFREVSCFIVKRSLQGTFLSSIVAMSCHRQNKIAFSAD